MALTDYTSSFKGSLNRASLAMLASLFQILGIGDVIRAMRTYLRGVDPDAAATNKYVVATAESITLPEDAKASTLIKAYSRAGTTVGVLTVDAEGDSAPAAGHVGVTPSGDIVFAAAADVTKVDLEYEPEKGDVVELTMSATSADTFDLPSSITSRGVLRMLEAESLTGGLVTKMIVQATNDAKPATTKARLKLNKATVQFAVADAVTSARFKLLVASAIDVNAKLEGASPTI